MRSMLAFCFYFFRFICTSFLIDKSRLMLIKMGRKALKHTLKAVYLVHVCAVCAIVQQCCVLAPLFLFFTPSRLCILIVVREFWDRVFFLCVLYAQPL